jgi:hypothetical protein
VLTVLGLVKYVKTQSSEQSCSNLIKNCGLSHAYQTRCCGMLKATNNVGRFCMIKKVWLDSYFLHVAFIDWIFYD